MYRDAFKVEGELVRSLIDKCAEKFRAYRYCSKSGEVQILFVNPASINPPSSRSGYDVSGIIVFEFENTNSCVVNTGVPMGNLGFGTGNIREFIEDYARKYGLKISNVESDIELPISSIISKPTPKAFLKSCVRCGRDIPIASEECKYCGAHQQEK